MPHRILIVILFAAGSLRAQHGALAAPQTPKNLTVLKDVPADQIGPAMQFISVSLGVECTFCHVAGKMEADDKPSKNTAREMIAMTNEINKTHFGARPQITCNSCHRGSTRPAGVPAVLESDPPAKAAMEALPPPGPAATPDLIIEKYVSALGGADAIRKITSRVMTGTILAVGAETPIEVIAKAPNKRVSITHASSGDSFTAFDGVALWVGNTGRPATQMSEAESMGSALDSEFYLSLRLKELYPQLRRGRPETVAGVNCEVLNGTSAGHLPIRLYFDKNNGLLVRLVRYAETPLGRIPTQIDYADYRESDGVKTPFRWTLSRPSGRFTIQIATVKNNVPLDDGRFAKPVGDVK